MKLDVLVKRTLMSGLRLKFTTRKNLLARDTHLLLWTWRVWQVQYPRRRHMNNDVDVTSRRDRRWPMETHCQHVVHCLSDNPSTWMYNYASWSPSLPYYIAYSWLVETGPESEQQGGTVPGMQGKPIVCLRVRYHIWLLGKPTRASSAYWERSVITYSSSLYWEETHGRWIVSIWA